MANALTRLWDITIDSLGNFLGLSNSAKESLMFPEGRITDDDIRRLSNSIRSNITTKYSKMRNLNSKDMAKVQSMVDDLYSKLMNVNPSMSPYMKGYLTKAKDDIRAQYDAAKNKLSDLQNVERSINERESLENTIAEDTISNAMNLNSADKRGSSAEFQELSKLNDRTQANLNNYERRMNDEI